MVSKRLSNILCGKEFDNAAPDYNNSIKNSNFRENTKFTPQASPKKKTQQKSLWFIPQISSKVKIRISKIVLQLLGKHFLNSINIIIMRNHDQVSIIMRKSTDQILAKLKITMVLAKKTFKEPYNNHAASFRNKNKERIQNSQNISGT